MAGAGSRVGMKLLSTLIGIPVGIVTKRLVDKTWVAARPDDPPKTVDDRRARWSDAVSWAALSAAGVAVAELATRKGAEAAYRRVFRAEPPPPKPTKAEKKAQKKLDKVDKTEAPAETTALAQS
jgi:hypothetical protein